MRLWSGQFLLSPPRVRSCAGGIFTLNPSPDCQIRFLNLMLHLFRGWSYDWCLRFGAPKTLHECEHSKQTGMKNDDGEFAWLHPTTFGFPFHKFRKMCRVAWDGQKFNSLNYCCRKWSVGKRCRMELEKFWRDFRVHKHPPQTTRCYTPASNENPKNIVLKFLLAAERNFYKILRSMWFVACIKHS